MHSLCLAPIKDYHNNSSLLVSSPPPPPHSIPMPYPSLFPFVHDNHNVFRAEKILQINCCYSERLSKSDVYS